MEKEFVPYELALKLKELGFNNDCLRYYDENSLFVNKITQTISCKAPLWQQAFDFFRCKYDIVYTIYANASGYMWEIHYTPCSKGGTFIKDSEESGDCEMSGMFTTYKKARLECLKELIKIAENKYV